MLKFFAFSLLPVAILLSECSCGCFPYLGCVQNLFTKDNSVKSVSSEELSRWNYLCATDYWKAQVESLCRKFGATAGVCTLTQMELKDGGTFDYPQRDVAVCYNDGIPLSCLTGYKTTDAVLSWLYQNGTCQPKVYVKNIIEMVRNE